MEKAIAGLKSDLNYATDPALRRAIKSDIAVLERVWELLENGQADRILEALEPLALA